MYFNIIKLFRYIDDFPIFKFMCISYMFHGNTYKIAAFPRSIILFQIKSENIIKLSLKHR